MTADADVYGFGGHIGIVVDLLRDGESRLSLQLADHHRNFFGIVFFNIGCTFGPSQCPRNMASTLVLRPRGDPAVGRGRA